MKGFIRVTAALVLLVALAGATYYWRYDNLTSSTEFWDTVTLTTGDVEAVVDATGTLNARTQVQVGTYVSGPVKRVLVDFNSKVRAGEILAEIDPAPYKAKVRQAEAALATASARLEGARVDYDFQEGEMYRTQDLWNKKVISQGILDKQDNLLGKSLALVHLETAAVQQTREALSEAQINLGYTRIVSPVDGVVLSRDVNVGQTVAASFQTPTLFEIAEDLKKMLVRASISETDIGQVQEGQLVRFTVDAWPDERFEGKVSQIRGAPVTTQNGVVTYDAIVNVDNRDLKLMPGMTATVEVVVAQRHDVPLLPVRALRFKPSVKDRAPGHEVDHPFKLSRRRGRVWVVQEETGKLAQRVAGLGIRSHQMTEVRIISMGLQLEERVVLSYVKQ